VSSDFPSERPDHFELFKDWIELVSSLSLEMLRAIDSLMFPSIDSADTGLGFLLFFLFCHAQTLILLRLSATQMPLLFSIACISLECT
jgi:hypothetical protein